MRSPTSHLSCSSRWKQIRFRNKRFRTSQHGTTKLMFLLGRAMKKTSPTRKNLAHRSTLLSHRAIHILDRAMRSAEDLYDIVYRRDMQHGCQPR
jgi:hypothetical protein